MFIFQIVGRSRLCLTSQTKLFKRISLYSTSTDQEIQIPKRIPREPTDILKALESTVSRDPLAPHYKYHDDPYLIPKSNIGKRTFAMAQEAGRKAALWIRQEHAELFDHKEADPPIEAFYPKVTYNDTSDVTEDDLKKVIDNVQVSDAQKVFQLLKDKGTEINPETLQSLLELVCYYNSEDTLSDDLIEERWFRQSSKKKERVRKTWSDGGFAEEVFISIDNPNAEAYSAIIQGMSKYYQAERAWELFEEAQKKGLVLSVNTYNSIIHLAGFLKEGYDLRWSFIMSILTQMKNAKLKPNLGTLNAVLHCLSTMGNSKYVKLNVLKVLAEFKKLGVEPSLGSWYYVLISSCKERGPRSGILHDIMSVIDNKEHKIRDLTDTHFFVTAMDVCRNHLRDANLGKRVNKLLNYGSNYDLIGDSYKESIYYRHYFILLCNEEPFNIFMENVYETLVPHVYVPEPGVMGEILNQVELSGAVEYLPKLWSDMVIFDHSLRENLLVQILNCMVNNLTLAPKDLYPQFANIALNIYNTIDQQREEKTNKVIFTGEILGNILILLLNNKSFEDACIIMAKLDKDHNLIVGVPKIEALSKFIDACIENKAPSMAINCIEYCVDCGFQEVNEFVGRLYEKLTLDERYLDRLSKIVDLRQIGKDNL